MKFKFFLMCLILSLSVVQAGVKEVGNGGFVLSCPNKIQLFDYFEIEQQGHNIQPIPGISIDDKVEYLLARLESIDPNRAKSYRFQFKNFWNDYQEKLGVEGLHLNFEQSQNPDYQQRFGLGNVSIPTNCELVLAMQQMAPRFDGPVRSRIRTNLYMPVWNRLDLDTKAALIMHELFYREYLNRQPPENSKGVRHLNGLLGTEDYNTYDSAHWISELVSVNFSAMFPDFQFDDASVDLEASFGTTNYDIYQFSGNYFYKPLRGKINLKHNLSLDITTATVTFWNGLWPKQFKLDQPKLIDLSNYSRGTLKFNVDPNCKIEINENLDLKFIGLNEYTWLADLTCKSFLDTYENENIKFSGPVKALFAKSDDTNNVGNVFLFTTAFSILQAKINGQWKDIAHARINTQTGAVISYRLPIN